jgi:hypothetical protein
LNHVRHERACQAVQRAVFAAVCRARDEQLLSLLDDFDVTSYAL